MENATELNRAIIGAEGGASTFHKNSQIIENNRILICCSNTVICLDLPTLNLNWKTKTDESTSFNILKIKKGYIIYGELEKTRIDKKGNVVWKNGGADIFVTLDGKDNFGTNDKYIKKTDWENRIYK